MVLEGEIASSAVTSNEKDDVHTIQDSPGLRSRFLSVVSGSSCWIFYSALEQEEFSISFAAADGSTAITGGARRTPAATPFL